MEITVEISDAFKAGGHSVQAFSVFWGDIQKNVELDITDLFQFLGFFYVTLRFLQFLGLRFSVMTLKIFTDEDGNFNFTVN